MTYRRTDYPLASCRDVAIEMMLVLLVRKIFGALSGMVVGSIACAILRLALDAGVSILPIADLFVQLSPGILLGGVCGFIIPDPFIKLLSWFMPG